MKIYNIIFENDKMYVSAFADRYDTRDIEELIKNESLFIARRFVKNSLNMDYYICRAKKDMANKVETTTLNTGDESKVFFMRIKTVDELKLLEFALICHLMN